MPRRDSRLNAKAHECVYGETAISVVTSPIGDIQLVICPRGVHALRMIFDDFELAECNVAVKSSSGKHDSSNTVSLCVEWLTAYFQGTANNSDMSLPPICHLGIPDKTATFTQQVWEIIVNEVRYGMTASYAEVAAKLNNSNACRAVGQAMRNNPVSIMIPCHRVISSTGATGNYASGRRNDVKAWLIKHEAKTMTL